MSHMKTFPRPTESNDQESKSGHRGGLLLMLAVYFTRKGLTNQLRLVKYFAQASDAP